MAIKIAGEIEKSLYNTTDLTRKELNKIAREAAYTSSLTKESFRRGIKETEPFFEGLEKAGVKTFKVLTSAAAVAGTAVIGIGTASAKAGIEFESAFAGVKKTTDATEREYEVLRKEILSMTRDIPAAGMEISEVAEAAGQLGIQKEQLLDFTRTMIDLGESTNLASAEGASSLAKFANITKMSADDYGRLGSTIVDLGNNFVTTEADIVGMSTRLASSGELAGFTEAQILAMATSMSSVGIEAEAGGSAMSKMIKTIQVAVETESKSLKEYAKVAGLSVNEFKDAFKKDGLSAVASFISGLNDIERNGKSATVILDEMGLTEIRLSNTLLSLASADNLMYKAVETANTAWKENTALTKEAAQRYETTESKLAIMKNGFTEMGIEISDQFNDPLREGIDIITDMVHTATEEISGSNVIEEIAQGIIEGVPTAIRITKTLAETIGDFAHPFLTVGGWLVDNPKLLESTIVGVSSALITYKTVKGISSLASAFASLGAASLPVFGVTGVVAAIGGITTSVKKSVAEAKKANLDRHFGNISLSMRELEEAAAYIVSNDSMGELQESINRLRELDGIDRSIEDAVSELNRMNWKVGIGMELSEDDQISYKQNIESYVTDIQRYIEEEQYAVNLAVGVLTEGDLESSNIVTQLNDFYAGKNAELARLGTELNEVVTNAFNDNLLNIPEAEKISELQQQIADMKAKLATGNYEAGLDLLGIKYAGGELDAETFMNMQAEINEQMELAKQYYDEAYLAFNQSQRAMLTEGTITQGEYDKNIKSAESGYLEQVGSLQSKAVDFQTDTILRQYSDVFGNIDNEILERKLEEIFKNSFQDIENGMPASVAWSSDQILYGLELDELGNATNNAIKELWDSGMAEQLKQMEATRREYLGAGRELPAELEESIRKASLIGMVAGDKESAWSAMGLEIADDEQYKEKIKEFINQGAEIPEAFAVSIIKNKEIVNEPINEFYDYTEQQLMEAFNKEMNVNLGINFMLNGRSVINPYNHKMKAYAEGGIATEPQLALIAEAGHNEYLIPADGSQRSVGLWQQAGEELGVLNKNEGFSSLAAKIIGDFKNDTSNISNNSEESNRFSYSPIYNFYGDAPNKKDLDTHIEESFEKWEEMMNRWIKDNQRYSFS